MYIYNSYIHIYGFDPRFWNYKYLKLLIKISEYNISYMTLIFNIDKNYEII